MTKLMIQWEKNTNWFLYDGVMRMLHVMTSQLLLLSHMVLWYMGKQEHSRIEIKFGHGNSFLVIVAIITLPPTLDQSESIWSGS